jgi:hypothetical protein
MECGTSLAPFLVTMFLKIRTTCPMGDRDAVLFGIPTC